MSGRDVLDVAVVGGGAVGAAAALALARGGLDVALVEARAPSPWRADAPDLRVYALAPDNAAWLDALGAWAPVRDARAAAYRAMHVWDAAGGGALRFDADVLATPQLGWIVEHALLVDRLWAALAHAGVRVVAPAQVVSLAQHEHMATLGVDEGGGARPLRARLVVAADGGDSPLRALAGIDAPVHAYGQRGLVAYVDAEHPLQATCWQRFLTGGPLALLPVDGGARAGHRGSIVWSLPDDEAARLLAADEATFARELAIAFEGRFGAFAPVSPRAAFPLRRQLAQRHVAGRVALVGDAAHVVHPLAGQGVNLGFRDAATLAAALGDPRGRDRDIVSAARLARWARTRRSENAVAAYAFDGLNRLFSNDAVLPTLVRGPLLGLAGRLPPLVHVLSRIATGAR